MSFGPIAENKHCGERIPKERTKRFFDMNFWKKPAF